MEDWLTYLLIGVIMINVFTCKKTSFQENNSRGL